MTDTPDLTETNSQPSLMVREISLDALPAKGSYEKITAEPDELLVIAQNFSLLEISALRAELEIHPWRAGLRVQGRLFAQLSQSCTITLDPVPQSIDEPIERVFLPESDIEKPPTDAQGAIILDDEKEDAPDILVGPMFDLGQIVLEQLALEIEPYPRAANAELDDVYQQEDTVRESPFSALAELKTTDKD